MISLSFCFFIRNDTNSYLKVKNEQNLNIDFPGYMSSVIKMFNNCHQEPQKLNLMINLLIILRNQVFFSDFHAKRWICTIGFYPKYGI